MNGDTAGLEPADSSREVDAAARVRSEEIEQLGAAAATLEKLHEYKAAREVFDATQRLLSLDEQERAAGQR